jgi:hypothetical protein
MALENRSKITCYSSKHFERSCLETGVGDFGHRWRIALLFPPEAPKGVRFSGTNNKNLQETETISKRRQEDAKAGLDGSIPNWTQRGLPCGQGHCLGSYFFTFSTFWQG